MHTHTGREFSAEEQAQRRVFQDMGVDPDDAEAHINFAKALSMRDDEQARNAEAAVDPWEVGRGVRVVWVGGCGCGCGWVGGGGYECGLGVGGRACFGL